MVNGNMVCGIMNTGQFMVRVGKENNEEALKRPHAAVMNFTGRPMKGFIYVEDKGIKSDKDLESWINFALDFNKTLSKK